MIAATLTPGDLAVGTVLPPFEKTFRAQDLMAYGAATWDWFLTHYDRVRAHELGFPDVFVDGQNFGALFAKQAFDWAGPRSFVTGMSLRFRAMVFVNESVAGHAEVVGLDGALVTLAQTLLREGSVVATCRTTVRLPAAAEKGRP